MAMFCTFDVLSMFVPCLFQYCTLCDVQVLTVQFNFTNTSNKLCYHATLYNEDTLEMLPHLLFLVDANPVVLDMPVHVLTQGHNGR